jgi:hypothetical protein
LSIQLHPHDASLAYSIKRGIGYGKVKKREQVTYDLTHPLGIEKVSI